VLCVLRWVGLLSLRRIKLDWVKNLSRIRPFLLLTGEPQRLCQLLKSPVINEGLLLGGERTEIKLERVKTALGWR